jgi:hypothetical protein
MQLDTVIAEMKRRHVVENVDWRLLPGLEAEQSPLLFDRVVQHEVVPMQINGNIEGVFGGTYAGDVIDMRMRQQDVLNLQVVIAASSSSTSSPGSMITPSRVRSHPTTNPFL